MNTFGSFSLYQEPPSERWLTRNFILLPQNEVYFGLKIFIMLKYPDEAQDGVTLAKPHISKPKLKFLCWALPEEEGLGQAISTWAFNTSDLTRPQDFPVLHKKVTLL